MNLQISNEAKVGTLGAVIGAGSVLLLAFKATALSLTAGTVVASAVAAAVAAAPFVLGAVGIWAGLHYFNKLKRDESGTLKGAIHVFLIVLIAATSFLAAMSPEALVGWKLLSMLGIGGFAGVKTATDFRAGALSVLGFGTNATYRTLEAGRAVKRTAGAGIRSGRDFVNFIRRKLGRGGAAPEV